MARRDGLKHHEWSAVDDELVDLGLVGRNSATNHTELTEPGAAEFLRRKRRAH